MRLSRPSSTRLLSLCTLLGGLLWSQSSSACGTCGSGDPTLTAAGAEQPYAGRQRYALDTAYRTDTVGRAGLDALRIRELRTSLTVAHAVHERAILSFSAPLVYRRVEEPNLAVHSQLGPGDLELRGKFFLFRDREFQPRFLAAAQAGVKAPTARFQTGSSEQPWPLEAQSGTGSWDVLAGPVLAGFQFPFSYYASAQLSQPVATRSDAKPGRSLRSTLALQYQFGESFALRAAHDTRWDARSQVAGAYDANSGGFVAFAGLDCLVSASASWTFLLGARAPWLERLNGAHDEGNVFSFAVTYDR